VLASFEKAYYVIEQKPSWWQKGTNHYHVTFYCFELYRAKGTIAAENHAKSLISIEETKWHCRNGTRQRNRCRGDE
jgi:hypothetical protein